MVTLWRTVETLWATTVIQMTCTCGSIVHLVALKDFR